jgi:hypothetical protein
MADRNSTLAFYVLKLLLCELWPNQNKDDKNDSGQRKGNEISL